METFIQLIKTEEKSIILEFLRHSLTKRRTSVKENAHLGVCLQDRGGVPLLWPGP